MAAVVLLLTTWRTGSAEPNLQPWSIQPLGRPAIPVSKLAATKDGNPIDQFIAVQLEAQGFSFAPAADRRTLIRRLYFDLIGLPPTPSEIEAFGQDSDTNAFDALVDRLLASPQYGERWARHWLDVVHFGETHGYDKDKPRPNAWPYRDYVIRSFNEDKPWSRFVEEQIAGDVLYPFTRDGIEALGFIAAGPWDFIGHAEVSESKMDGKVARHLDRDDMVANTMQTFNSLTVQCAQCHDHKFDPISQEDYYSLQAVFAAVDRADKEYDGDGEVAKTRAGLDQRQRPLIAEQKQINDFIRSRAGDALGALNESLTKAEKTAKQSEAFGYHSGIEAAQSTTKWVQIDLGRTVALKQIVLRPAKDDFNHIGEGFGFPLRFRVEAAEDPGFASTVRLIVDRTTADVANPGGEPQLIDARDLVTRFIRVTATKLAPRQDDFILALAELSAIDAAGTNVAVGAIVTALDSIESPARWQKANLTDGWYPGATQGGSTELAGLRSAREELLTRSTLDEERERLAVIGGALEELHAELGRLPPTQRAYVAGVYSGSGTFTGTGAKGGRARPIYLLNRGSVQSPGREVGAGTLNVVPGLAARFELPPDHGEGERRAALAKWLSDSRNPLTWRSIVNSRCWNRSFTRTLTAIGRGDRRNRRSR